MMLRASSARTLRWVVNLGLLALVLMGLGLLFLLTQATGNRALYEQNYARLFVVNVVLAGLLLLVIGWIAWRLFKRLQQKKFGSQLLVKLAAVFALAGFAPGMLIYVVSYQFVTRSIESWFDVKVEGALDAGLNLGRTSLEALTADLVGKAHLATLQFGATADASAALSLERVREAIGVDDLLLWGKAGRLIAAAGQSRYQLSPELPDQQQFRNARTQRLVSWIEGLDDAAQAPLAKARIKVLVLQDNSGLGNLSEQRYLLLVKALPTTLVANALAVTQANREYQERALARQGLRRMYIGTLTLSLFMAVFGGVLLAILLGNQIARPLLLLADGVRQVAAGDLTPKPSLRGHDELDGLTRSFADMTEQLAEARQAVQASMQQVTAARANVQTILDNLTAGVIVLDSAGVMVSSNPGASRILRLPLASFAGQRMQEIASLASFAASVQAQFAAFLEGAAQGSSKHWQQSFEIAFDHAATPRQSSVELVTLVARGAELPEQQRLLVFDDISEIVSAQRAQAWGEVARRLAHEIKNPLTPIQLSAERLSMKLAGKLDLPDQTLLHRSVKTIVDQVDAMKRLVNEFRDYARLPRARLQSLDLNLLVSEVLQLYQAENALIPVQLLSDEQAPHVLGDAQQVRQVLHNLLQNAQDASQSAGHADAQHPIVVKTRWQKSLQRVRLTVLDNGTGFAEHLLKRVFEPYVTTKDKGTGLGLAVVKKIADEHGSKVDINNRIVNAQVVGAQVSLSFAIDAASAQAPD